VVDIVVKGRRLEVSDRFRTHVEDKLAKVERLVPALQRVDVEVSKELNPRLADRAYRVQLTCRSRGPVIRAEAAAVDKLAALDVAMGRLESRLRKAADRRTDRKHERAAAVLDGSPDGLSSDGVGTDRWPVPEDEGPMVVRVKTHAAEPMSLDQALYEMELVGHDFFLFVDEASGCPSVVYRRQAYHYGVIHLSLDGAASGR
jgi:ribosomal subunit interface protein